MKSVKCDYAIRGHLEQGLLTCPFSVACFLAEVKGEESFDFCV